MASLRSRLLTPLLGLIAAGGLAGCNDSVACVFSAGCQGGSGGLAEEPSIFPTSGATIRDGPPTILGSFPRIGNAAGTTPIVIAFSESMNEETLGGAFEIISFLGGIPNPPLVGLSQLVLAEAQLVVILPPTTLVAGDYVVRLSDTLPTDLTGQTLSAQPSTDLFTFTVSTTPPIAPRVVATFPPDGSTDQSDTSEVVVVFDREIDGDTVTDDSFIVLTDGLDPTNDPLPTSPSATFMGVPGPADERILVWQSASAPGVPASLGQGAVVEVTLSPDAPPGDELADAEGDFLEEFTFSFTTTLLGAPTAAELVSQPFDAIGLRNLTAGNAEELELLVSLPGAEPGDIVDAFVFGTDTNQVDPRQIAIRRSVTLAGMAPILEATFTLADLDLLVGTAPTDGRFSDGPLAFAFRLRRGSAGSPVFVLDVDPDTDGVQDVLLDTVGPSLTELLYPGGATSTFDYDLGDVVLIGRASEAVLSVEVSTPLGDNGILPPVVGSTDNGLFVAAPVEVAGGLLPGGTTTYTLVAYDFAFNPSAMISGTYRQLGRVGTTAFTPGTQVSIDVFDSQTLSPIPGARVVLTADAGNGTTFPFTDSGFTDANGEIQLTSAGAAAGAIVTVDVLGFDLFTFHGLTSRELSIPVTRSGSSSDMFLDVTTQDPALGIFLPGLTGFADDTRRPFGTPRLFAGDPCVGFGLVTCAFGPEEIAAGRVGAASYLAGDFDPATAGAFVAPLFLQAFGFVAPITRAASGDSVAADIVPLPLSASNVAVEYAATQFFGGTATGLDLMNLVGDPATTGAPRVTVETLLPGLSGSLTVGLGAAFDQGGNIWVVRAAHPPTVGPGGDLALDGVVDDDLFLRVELRDANGNLSGQRPRASTLAGLSPVPFGLAGLGVSQLSVPGPGGNSGGASTTLRITDVFPDGSGLEGLYRVRLTDAAGRRWELWKADTDGTTDLDVHLPDLASLGGAGLANGTITYEIAAFSWPGLDPGAFLWSDVEREHDFYSQGAPGTFSQP